ncbi:MAG TPA: porin [Micropepsaceae bacterium]|nr:porin [Micropepsaceae bacterium]
MTFGKPSRAIFLTIAAFAALSPFSADAAEGSRDLANALSVDAPSWEFDNTTIRLGGVAAGALFSAHQSAGPGSASGYDNTSASSLVRANIQAQRIFDNGMVVGARSDFLLHHDAQSHDQYGNDTVEKIYAFAQTGFGRIEIGQQDGAADTLGLVGPVTNEQVTLENRGISLFRDPVTGGDFGALFKPITAVQSTSNFAKINYVSPRLLGIQIGASFTPKPVRTPLPFTGNLPSDPNQQQNIWEVAASYTGYFSNLALGLSAGLARGSVRNRNAAGDDLSDWALGAQLAYPVGSVKLSLGGAYRDSNAYLLELNQVLTQGRTHASHLSATAEWGSWIAGGEYSLANAKGPVDYDITGYQLSAGYKLNDNLQLTGGWQWFDYSRNAGVFYNGSPKLRMNAGFLLLSYEL